MERTYEFPVVAFVTDKGDEPPAIGWPTVLIRDLGRRIVLDLVLRLGGLAALVEEDGQRHRVRLTGSAAAGSSRRRMARM